MDHDCMISCVVNCMMLLGCWRGIPVVKGKESSRLYYGEFLVSLRTPTQVNVMPKGRIFHRTQHLLVCLQSVGVVVIILIVCFPVALVLLDINKSGNFRVLFEDVTSVESFVIDLNDKVDEDVFGMEFAYQIIGGAHRTSSGQ